MDTSLIRPGPGHWTTAAAQAWCLALARRHYENFPVASLFIPARLRPHVAAVYAFARIADDIADEPGMERKERLAYLEAWRKELEQIIEGDDAGHPAFIALRETMRTHDLPPDLLRALLSAFHQDVVKNRYETFGEVRDYCRRSAEPVGRIILRLFGHNDPNLDAYSDAVCTALQLTNFWQDLSQDLARDRLYLPLEDLDRFGIARDPASIPADEGRFRELIAFQVERTRALFQEGKTLPNHLQTRLSLQIRLTWHGGMRVLEKIERTGYNVLHTRPKLIGIDAAVIGYRALTRA